MLLGRDYSSVELNELNTSFTEVDFYKNSCVTGYAQKDVLVHINTYLM